ncbi:MAG: hypothetical protein JJT94_00865 [Bernardetiaceae bacterium]|nr:hypothetical protein [Bernardetiaceae bacterium]
MPYDKYRGHDEETIKNRIWHAEHKKDDTYRRELKGADINRYQLHWNGKLWISYGSWLAAPRDKTFFTSKRILVREITSTHLFCCYTEEEYYNTPSLINIIDKKESVLSLKYTLSILNSKLIGWYHNKVSPKARKGLFPKILINDIKNIPIPEVSASEQSVFESLADKMLSLHGSYLELRERFLGSLSRRFDLEKPSRKLESWYELSYKEFIKELGKKKIKLSLSEESEWESYFVSECEKVGSLRHQISETDAHINRLVYALYDLDEAEILIVEQANDK